MTDSVPVLFRAPFSLLSILLPYQTVQDNKFTVEMNCTSWWPIKLQFLFFLSLSYSVPSWWEFISQPLQFMTEWVITVTQWRIPRWQWISLQSINWRQWKMGIKSLYKHSTTINWSECGYPCLLFFLYRHNAHATDLHRREPPQTLCPTDNNP